MSNNIPPQPMKTAANGKGMNFLSSLLNIKTSRSAIRIQLARKVAHRKAIKNRIRKQQQRLREMAQKYQNTEAELHLVNETIKDIKKRIETETEDDET